MTDFWNAFDNDPGTEDMHEKSRHLGLDYEKRGSRLQWMSPTGYAWTMTRPEPPPRYRWHDGGVNHAWVAWHRVRGINPYAPRKRRGSLPNRLRDAVLERDGFVCGICGDEIESGDLHIDHILPVARGGTNDLDNLQPAHSFCNISKGARVVA